MVTMDNMTDGNASFLRAARSGNLEKVIEHLKGNIDINTSNANGLNALHLAAKEGHVVVVTELLKRGANVNAATKKGNTALHIASLAGQEEVVRVLIQLGANVNVQSQNGFTPLYMAAQENHDHVVSFLLANGANQSLATEDGFTPLAVALQQGHDRVVAVLLENDTKGRVRLPALHIAAKKDDCKAATLLLQSDHNPDVTSKSGFTPLHIAAHYGNENIAKILLSKGADVNYAAKHQITPLHVASKWGKTNMVVLLLEKGAKIEASTRDGLTPLHCASRSGHEQVVDLLLEKGAPFLAKTKNGLAPLHMASQGDHVDSARILLYHKAPVDDVTVDYLTALHVAAHCGHVKVAKLLLDRKADPNARALNGFTPLHIACKKNRIKVVELLLKHGASIEATTESGLTPLHVASFMGCMNIVIYLIQNGAHPDVPTVRGETPLHLAARANQTDIIRILLRNGASVDARAREEQTPLHIAARLGNVDIVSLLLQHGAAVDAVTKDMYTALHIAAKEDQEEVASALLDHGASLTSTTKKGFTPLHLAAKYGNIKVARLLLQKGAPVDAQGKNGVTPLHVAAHYDHVNVALLLLDKGASPHAMAKNGYTPLHIAAKKNQMDIASTLLEYGAKTNSESKAGFTPLHLSSQEGHAEMSALLIEHKADVNHRANNGLTPLHLCAQDDRVSVASILTKNGAEVCPKTKAGYTPLHVAAHFGQINMVRFLLQNEASVHNTTSHGYTPLHQAAQQGHTLVVNLLLENQASPNVTTMQGQTPLSIAQRLGYISVVETLKVVTETTVITTTTTVTEEKYKVVAPETMQETFMTDSEDEGGADFDEAAFFGKPTHATHVYLPYVEGKHFLSEEAMLGDQSYRYLTADEMKSLGDDSLPIDVTKDEKHHDVMQSVKQFGAPMVEEDNLSPQHVTPVESGFSEKYSPDNVDLARAPVHAGSFSWDDDFYYSFPPKGMLRSSRLKWKTFLVSFMVDARGGAMRGCRHSGVRVIIPPRKAAMPMRITCRYLRKEKLIHPPPLMEGEACASRILEMGPVSAKFLGPVIIEVPHFASTRGKEREIIILRSDTGESWREHTLEASEEAVQEVLNESFEGEELSALEDLNTNRITRILTTDFPQYFAIVCRVRQESHGVGPEGGMVSSTVVPQVQAIFPEGALTKKIRVGLQAQPIAPELVAKLLGNRVAVSPIVTVEPRRRKFHKPITLTIPVPQAVTKGMINQYSGEAPTLRLLCSITGGSSKAQWEDVTGSTPLTFVNDCVSFTTTVSARFWLMDCRQVNEVTRFATELYQEAVYVPFMSKFVIFAKRNDPYEAQLRVFCMTDDKEDKTLESQEHFTEVAKSRDVEVLEGKTEYLEFAGNLVPVTKSGEQLKFTFQAFHENRLPFTIRVKDPHAEPMGRIAFMREPRAGRGEPPQVPICNLNVALPDITLSESSPDVLELVTLEKRYDFIQEAGLSKPELIHRADLRLSDIARELDKDWISLAQQLDLSEGDIEQLKSETAGEPPEQALIMLRMWLQKSGPKATGNELEKALRRINREDIINHCMFNVELVTDDVEKAVAKVHLDQSGFDVFKEELGSSREASMRRGASLDISYDEQDIMKEAESAAETSSETGSLFEREHIPHSLTDDKVEKPEIDESAIILAEVVSKNDNETSGLNSNTICDSLCVELDSSSLNRETSQTASSNGIIDDQQNENIDRTDVTIASLNESRSESQIENEKCQNNRKLHEFWPPDKISLNEFQRMSTDAVPKEIKTINTKNETDFEENSYLPSSGGKIYIEDINISPSNSTHLENAGEKTNRENDLNKSHNFDISNVNEVNDLGYCSMDKDPSNSSVSKTIIDDKKDIIDISRLDQKFSDSEKYPVCIMPCEPKMNMVEILNNRNIQMQNLASKQLDSNFNLGLHPPDELSRVDLSQFPVEETTKATNLKSEVENQDLPKNTSTSGCDIDAERADNNLVEDGKIRRASKTPPPSPVDEEVIQDKRADTLKDISPSALVFHIKEDTFKKQVDTTGEANMPPVAQELVARLTESETWPSGDLDTSQVSVSSLPDDEKSEANTAVFETTVVSTKETISTLGASDTFIPATTEILQTHAEQDNVEKTEVDGSGSTTHIIQKTTHMTIVGKIPDEVLAGEGDLRTETFQAEAESPESPELSFAEKRDFFQKLSLSSSSPSVTPTHTAKSSVETEIRLETIITEDNAFSTESPEEHLSFVDRLKFFEKSSEDQTPAPEVKEIKRETWTIVASEKKDEDSEIVHDSEKEREVETIEVQTISEVIFRDTQVSLPLYESKEVLETIDSNKDTKVEVIVKTFSPGSEQVEICAVENIPKSDASEVQESNAVTSNKRFSQESLALEADAKTKAGDEARVSESSVPGVSTASEQAEKIISDEEFLSRTLKSFTESSYEVSKNKIDAFKKEAGDKGDNKWQRESPDNISIVKETMEPSLGKSEIFICTEETLDSVKKILSVAEAESNVVLNESEPSSSDVPQEQDKKIESKDEIFTKVETKLLESQRLSDNESMKEIEQIEPNSQEKEIVKTSAEKQRSDQYSVTQEEKIKTTSLDTSQRTKYILSEDIVADSICDTYDDRSNVDGSKNAVLEKMSSETVEKSVILDQSVVRSQENVQDILPDSNVDTLDKTVVFKDQDSVKLEELRAKIEKERENGIHFEETLSRSVGSNESCFSSSKDHSVEIEFLPVLEVSDDVSKVSVDKTGHEALGTPCSFHKEMTIEGQHLDLEKSFEERQSGSFDKKIPLTAAVEKAEYEEREKHTKENLEEMIYRESKGGETSDKETLECVEVTQFKEHSTEVYNLPSQKLMEKFSSKKLLIEASSEEVKIMPTQKLNQFLDSVTQIEDDTGAYSLPSDLAPVHKRTEEWLDQSGEIMLKEGSLIDVAEIGLFEDRVPTLEDEQHKRSSPTAESFDDKARVEQCDTDVMMQLLDFVSRNDVELSEVRTEDEAPDIEEDVSPSTEEEICTSVTYDNKVETETKELVHSEEKTRDCLKVAETENLLLSPLRSSFDSVTSPSRKDFSSEIVDTVMESKPFIEKTDIGAATCSRQIIPQSSLEVEVGSHGSDEIGVHDNEKEMTPLSYVEEEEHSKIEFEGVEDGKPWATKNIKCEDQALKSGIVLEEHSQPSHEQLIPADQKDAEPKITTVELTTTKQIEEAMPVKDSQALRTEIVEETAADTSKDVVEESSKEEVIQSKETSSVAQVIPTERKMTEEITSTECQSSTSAQIYEVREEGFSKTEPSQEHVLKASESTDEDLVVGMEESSFVKKEIISDSTVVKQFVPCAFDNTAFAGADFIDEVEQAVPVRARSPYEVIREDQGEVPALGIGQTLNENVIKEVSGSVSKIDFMPKQMDIRRRPILQHIPSEISEEDLVEREIISPVTKEFEVFEEADIKGQGPLGTEFSHSVIGTAAEISSSIDDDKQSDFNKGNGSESPIISENIIHSDSNEIPSPHSVHHISSHTERDADESKIKKQVENLRSPPNSLPIKRDLIESVIKTDEGTTPESDTGLPTSPFELISGSEISDEEHKTGLPSSITLMKSDQEDRSQDSVITTTQSQSYTESTFSASIRTSSKDLSDSCTHNEGLQFQSSKTTRTGITTFTKTLKDTSDEYMQEMDKQLLNGPGEVEYRPEYDDDHEYRPEERLSGFETMRVSEGSANDAFESDDYKKSRYSSVSDDVIDSEIGEICNSDQVLEDIIERPVTPEPPKDDERDLIIETHVKREFHSSRSETLDFKREEFLPSTADEQLILSPLGSPDELKPGFAYGMQFEKEILDPTEEAMDIDSDQYSEEKEPPYAYGMRFERDPDLEEDEIPCYGDLYTHEEEDEDALENGEKPKSFQKQVKEADFDILAGRKYFSKNVEFDDLSMSSLQEFERLEAEIVSGRKSSIGSLDSLNGKNHTSKSGEHDDVSMSSLTEFERIERECTETEKIDPAMQESITQLSEIEEGHESQASEASHGKSDEAKEDLSILDDQDLKLQDIDEMILDPPGIAPEEQPYQYIIQKSHTTAKGVSSSILKKESTDYAGAQDAAENQIEIRKMTTIKHVSDTRQKSVETYSNDSVKEDDMDQDSLRDEFSLKPDSLIDDGNKDFQDSLHEDKLDDADSLQGDIPDEMRDSLFEEKQIEDDSLHEMDILPDESSLSLESSLAAALSHDSSKADDRKRYSFDGESDALRLNLRDIVTSSDKAEVVVTDYMRGDVMVSSTDSLEQSRSAAFAAFQMESESAMSSSLNSAITSEDYTMFSSTDTLEHEGRITFRYEDIPVDDLETLIRDGKKVFVDSEGNIQAQYNVKHILEAEDNINSLCSREKTEVELPSSTTVHVHSAVTSVKYADDRTKMSAPIPFSTTTGVKTEDISYESSDFDPNVEVEEVHTTDEFGNPKIIRKVKRFVHTKTQFSSSSSPKDVEEKLKEFLRKNAAGEGAGMGEEEIKEEKTTDAKGNVVLIRTVQQQMLSEPQVHSKTFMGPDADTLSQDFVETFKTLDPTENVCEYEKIDDQGNVVRVTQQVIIKPEVHSISFSGPNARQQMEDYMKQWTATSQSADEYEAGKTSTFFTADELHRFSEQSQQHGVSESSIHSCVEEPSESKVFASQSSERVTVQADAAQASSSGKEETHETRVEEPQQ